MGIDHEAISRMARDWQTRRFLPPAFDYPGLPPLTGPDWCNFCLLSCSVVGCLWPPEGHETWQVQLGSQWLDDAPGLFACFARRPELELDDYAAFDPAAGVEFFAGRGTLQLIAERAVRLAAVAATLIDRFDGQVVNLLHQAGWDAPRAVELIVEEVPGYHDQGSTPLGTLPFYKLAHLTLAMMSSRLEPPLARLDTFPVYPDYMLPRFLHHRGVLVYEKALVEAVDNRRLIPSGSRWELAIRWATVYASDRLAEELTRVGNPVTLPSLDYAMWHEAVLGPEAARMGEHHRTVTLAY